MAPDPVLPAELAELMTLDAEALRTAACEHGLDLIVLFGSTTRGRRRRDSDLDVAIHFAPPRSHLPTIHEEAMAETALYRALKPACDLDMVVLNGASPLLMWNVAQHGVPLFAASATCWTMFRIRAHREYEDSARFRQRQWQVLLRRIHGDSAER